VDITVLYICGRIINAKIEKKNIGQNIGKIDDGYTGSGTIFKKYFYSEKYYGFWRRTILKYCNTKQELDEEEIFFINKEDAVNSKLFCNSKSGGTGKSGILSEDTRKKMSDKKQGYIPWNKGIPCKQETRDKLSNRLKGRKAWNKGIKGSTRSIETISKTSSSLVETYNKKRVLREKKVLEFITKNETITSKQVGEIIDTRCKRSSLKVIWSLVSQNKIKKVYRGSRKVVYTLV